jgi:C-terminal processing protease CtpA/Prc
MIFAGAPGALVVNASAAATRAADSSPDAKQRTAVFDEIWRELSTHDAFFDPKSPAMRALRDEYRPRIAELDDPLERLREIVRWLSRIEDGHTHLTTRWLLPDKPPPPLALAGDQPLFRPALHFTPFHKDCYLRLEFPAEPPENGRPAAEDCRVIGVDGARVSHGGGWGLLNGPRGSNVEIEFERPDGRRTTCTFERTVPVVPPEFFTTTTQAVVKDPQSGEEKTRTIEIVVESRRLEDNLGYIRIAHLMTPQAVADFNRALDELMDTDGLILDLRDNSGGYPWIMLPITGRFYSTYQKVCSFDGRSPTISGLLRAVGQVGIAPTGRTYEKPLVVLINDDTASMCEGLAFSLGDTGRAVLAGRPTRGLNAAIRNVTLSNGLVLWHSWVRVNRLDGQHYQNIGVQPHERVEVAADEIRALGVAQAARVESQRQYEHAVRRLRELVAKATASPPAAHQP